MAKLRMTIELEYDAGLMYGPNDEDIAWFLDTVLGHPDPAEGLILHSNYLGDDIGNVKVLSVEEDTVPNPDALTRGLPKGAI